MSKAKRKPRPSVPNWWWLDTDNCWRCKNKQNCNGCSFLKKHKKKQNRKIIKQNRKNIQEHDFND